MNEACKACGTTARLPDREVRRLVEEYLREHPGPTVTDAECARRLALCRVCPDLIAGTTCRHCGCLVPVLARLQGKACADPVRQRW